MAVNFYLHFTSRKVSIFSTYLTRCGNRVISHNWQQVDPVYVQLCFLCNLQPFVDEGVFIFSVDETKQPQSRSIVVGLFTTATLQRAFRACLAFLIGEGKEKLPSLVKGATKSVIDDDRPWKHSSYCRIHSYKLRQKSEDFNWPRDLWMTVQPPVVSTVKSVAVW